MKAILRYRTDRCGVRRPCGGRTARLSGRWSHVPAVECKSTPDATLAAGGLEGNEDILPFHPR